jgi:signal transduction histidine kinase
MSKSHIPKSLRELNILIKISQDIIGTLDFDRVLQVISDGIAELLEIETAAIYIIENEVEVILRATTPPLPPEMPYDLRRALIAHHPHIRNVINNQKPYVIDNAKSAELSPEEKKVVEMRRLRSLIFYPFIFKKEVLGVLILGTCNKTRRFSQHEIELGQTIANQFSVAIQNARLHDDLKNHKENLEKLVLEKTQDLNAAIEELQAANEELFTKNEIINSQNHELKATLQHLKETQMHLFQSEKMASIGTLTAGVAHEINNPLNFIKGAYLGLIKYYNSKAEATDQNVFILLDSINTGVERISTIINSLNQFSGGTFLSKQECSIHVIIDNCLVILNNQINNRIVVQRKFTKTNLSVKGNLANLHHAFLNILTNAIQSIDNDGFIGIKTAIERPSKKLIVEIEDNGKGISPENIGKITDPFFTTKDPGKGTGLGLSITYKVIKEHNGSLEFQSEVGKGTLVRIELPLT